MTLLLGGLRRMIGKWATSQITLEQAHKYWTRPDDGRNDPNRYVADRLDRSEFLASKIEALVCKDDPILEIGCNAGRNVAFLNRLGYSNITAIEISADAIAVMANTYPGLPDRVRIIQGAVENVIQEFSNRQFTLAFSMAVFEHIHSASEWVFPEITRIASTIVTIEDEYTVSPRHFPRNYKKVFENAGATQIAYSDVPPLGPSFRYRAFRTRD